jgi:hypothetical protein
MPDSIVENGEVIQDKQLVAARTAMILLADFQNTRNVTSLYKSVDQIAVYAGVDIVDLMLSLKDIQVESGQIDDLLDIAAKNLFKTVSNREEFDYQYYAAILLSVAHAVSEDQRQYLKEIAQHTMLAADTPESESTSQ